jgi:hypothetical protein
MATLQILGVESERTGFARPSCRIDEATSPQVTLGVMLQECRKKKVLNFVGPSPQAHRLAGETISWAY